MYRCHILSVGISVFFLKKLHHSCTPHYFSAFPEIIDVNYLPYLECVLPKINCLYAIARGSTPTFHSDLVVVLSIQLWLCRCLVLPMFCPAPGAHFARYTYLAVSFCQLDKIWEKDHSSPFPAACSVVGRRLSFLRSFALRSRRCFRHYWWSGGRAGLIKIYLHTRRNNSESWRPWFVSVCKIHRFPPPL